MPSTGLAGSEPVDTVLRPAAGKDVAKGFSASWLRPGRIAESVAADRIEFPPEYTFIFIRHKGRKKQQDSKQAQWRENLNYNA